MKLNIDENKFLAAVDTEGDHEVGVGMADVIFDTCTCSRVVVSDAQAVAELKADNERLRAALRPFAEAADGFDMTRIKNPEEWFAYRGIVSATEAKGAITVGDLRRARAALDGQPAPGKEEA